MSEEKEISIDMTLVSEYVKEKINKDEIRFVHFSTNGCEVIYVSKNPNFTDQLIFRYNSGRVTVFKSVDSFVASPV